jgi:ribosomal protein S27AE
MKPKKEIPKQKCSKCGTVMTRQKKGCYICPKCGWELVFWPYGCG